MMSFNALLPMDHYTDFDSLAGALGHLQAGRQVRTDVEPPAEDEGGVPWFGRPVFLTGGDIYCDACRCVIFPDDNYQQGWPNVLARQKVKHGGTWCEDCFGDGAHREDTEDDTDNDRERTFG
jgi:hypothetical protein